MECVIDWLSFTVHEYEGKPATAESVVTDIFNLDFKLFEDMGRGGYGYKAQYLYNDIRVYFNGTENMGIHVVISSQGIRFLETIDNFEWKGFLFLLTGWFNAKVTRLDIAVDEYDGILDLQLMESKMKTGEIVSRWRVGRPVNEYCLSTGEATSSTLYFGSRQSEVLCRFYDKRKEQMNKGKEVTKEHWIRCELELHQDRANTFALIYSERNYNKTIGEMFAELLNNYMRVTDAGEDTNRSRWENNPMWDKFMTTAGKLKLSTRKPDKKMEDVYNWMKKSISPSLNLLFQAAYGDLDLLFDLIKEGAAKLNKKHLIILSEYRERSKEKPLTLNDVKHGIREKIYNTNWYAAELHQGIQSLISVLGAIKNKKSITFEQIAL